MQVVPAFKSKIAVRAAALLGQVVVSSSSRLMVAKNDYAFLTLWPPCFSASMNGCTVTGSP
ncbi:hypothetical protein [Streptomyces mirabilis]|uniref:hypothetical protein n=1 Tax=Streptomyces mirabilis TaxID=68239 RepID=UPI00324B3A07